MFETQGYFFFLPHSFQPFLCADDVAVFKLALELFLVVLLRDDLDLFCLGVSVGSLRREVCLNYCPKLKSLSREMTSCRWTWRNQRWSTSIFLDFISVGCLERSSMFLSGAGGSRASRRTAGTT